MAECYTLKLEQHTTIWIYDTLGNSEYIVWLIWQNANSWTWFPIEFFLLIKYWLLPQALDWKSKGLKFCLTRFCACKIIDIFWDSILLQFKSIISFQTCTCLMLLSRGNLKDTSVWQALKRYNYHIQNVYPKSDLFQDFLFSFPYGLCALHLTLNVSNSVFISG